MISDNEIKNLKKKSAELRLDILNMIFDAKKGHIGGAYSCLDLLTTLYYTNLLNISPKNLNFTDRDIFILSKGHSAVAQYTILADQDFFDKKFLKSFNHEGSFLGEHPDRGTPGIEADSGSLGHGLAIAAGIALASKINNIDNHIVTIIGDGECYEGSVWETLLFANQNMLDNFIIILDRNNQLTLSFTEECNKLEPLSDKFKSFGFDCHEIDGHDHREIYEIISELKNKKDKKPKLVLANTIKGKGISFMERNLKWHHGLPNEEEKIIALLELEKEIKRYD